MDQSIEYVKMCNCPEIQGRWELKEGDWVCWPISIIEAFNYSDFDAWTVEGIKEEGGFWIALQCQLQEMLKPPIQWQMAHRENDYVASVMPEKKNITIYCYASTAEQALLQLVMSELHGKKWNGEEWVK